MSKRVLVVAPHPDDETLGCGGTLLRHKAQGDRIYWLILTGVHEEWGFSISRVTSRAKEIEAISKLYGFDRVFNLSLPSARLETIPKSELIDKVSSVFTEVQAEIVYLPFQGDIHSDHTVAFQTSAACTKWFRFPSVKRVLCYEVLSETEIGPHSPGQGFTPNVFVDIADYLNRKIEIMAKYEGEIGNFPFPRSEKAIRSLAYFRGATSGLEAAEAFLLLKEIFPGGSSAF